MWGAVSVVLIALVDRAEAGGGAVASELFGYIFDREIKERYIDPAYDRLTCPLREDCDGTRFPEEAAPFCGAVLDYGVGCEFVNDDDKAKKQDDMAETIYYSDLKMDDEDDSACRDTIKKEICKELFPQCSSVKTRSFGCVEACLDIENDCGGGTFDGRPYDPNRAEMKDECEEHCAKFPTADISPYTDGDATAASKDAAHNPATFALALFASTWW
jgi:hypothetical protein